MSASLQQTSTIRSETRPDQNAALQAFFTAVTPSVSGKPTQAAVFAELHNKGVARADVDGRAALVEAQSIGQTHIASLVQARKITAHLTFHTPNFAKPAVNTAKDLQNRTDPVAPIHRNQVQSFSQLAESGQDIALIASESDTHQALQEAPDHAGDPNWFTPANLQTLNRNLQLYPSVSASLVPRIPPEAIGATYVMQAGGDEAVFAIRTHQAQGRPTGQQPMMICADAKSSLAQTCLQQVADLRRQARPYEPAMDFPPAATRPA